MKMSFQKLVLLSIFGVFLRTSAAFAQEDNYWPDLSTDQGKMQLMLWDQTMMSSFFQGMTEYEVNYFDVLQKQHNVNSWLANDPRYANYLRTRYNRVQIDFTVQSKNAQQAAPAQAVDQDALRDYEILLKTTFESLPAEQRTFEGLRDRIIELEKIYPSLSVKNFFTALIKLLPANRRSQVFPLPLDQKIEVLKNEITPEIFAKMDPKDKKAMGEMESIAGTEAIVNALQARDQQLENLYGLATVAAHQSETVTGRISLDFENLGLQQIAIIGDKAGTFQQLKRFLTDHRANVGADLLSKPRQSFMGAVVVEAQLEKHSLVEVPARMGWAGSCVGGDCSTKNMAAFVNVPTKHKFIFDYSPESSRGFFDVDTVGSYGKQYLRVTLIQGGRMSPDMMVYGLMALCQKARNMGAVTIMLPTWEDLKSHTNYNDLRDRLQAIVAGKPETHFTYLDNEVREALRAHVNDASYNTLGNADSSKNRGVIIHLEDLQAAIQISSEIKEAPEFPFFEAKISDGEAMLLVFEVEEVAGSFEVGKRMLNAMNISSQQYETLKPILYNQMRLPTKEFFASVASALKQHGYDFDVTFKKNRLASLYPGFLRCPDAWSAQWFKKAFDASYSLLQRQGTVDLVIESTQSVSGKQFDISQHPQLLETLRKGLDNKYLDRRAAGTILLGFNYDHWRVYPVLFGIAKESKGGDFALNDLFRAAQHLNPEEFRKNVIQGLGSDKEWIQQGALTAVEKANPTDLEIGYALNDMQKWGGSRSKSVYDHALHVGKMFWANSCDRDLSAQK